jgi:hypothetical protein
VAVTVEWSVVPILAGDGQGLGVFCLGLGARRRCAERVVGDLEGAAGNSGVADQVEPSGVRGARLRTRSARGPAAGRRGAFGHAEHGGQHDLWLEDLGSDAMRWQLDEYGKAFLAPE